MKIPLRTPRVPREPSIPFSDYEVSLSLSTIPPAVNGGPTRTAISLSAVPFRVLTGGAIERATADAISWATGDAEAETDAAIVDALDKLNKAITRLIRKVD